MNNSVVSIQQTFAILRGRSRPIIQVRIYLCGVTVYDDSPGIGHARTIVVFDVLRRFLISREVEATLIQNFTDGDDKIINKSQARWLACMSNIRQIH